MAVPNTRGTMECILTRKVSKRVWVGLEAYENGNGINQWLTTDIYTGNTVPLFDEVLDTDPIPAGSIRNRVYLQRWYNSERQPRYVMREGEYNHAACMCEGKQIDPVVLMLEVLPPPPPTPPRYAECNFTILGVAAYINEYAWAHIMARNLRQVLGLTLTRVRESTVVADFADVNMHAPPAFIIFMGSQEKEIRSFEFSSLK